MKFLTKKQKLRIRFREIKVEGFYMFPRFGFYVYANPIDLSDREWMGINPFTKSLDHQRFVVKEKINGFCRGNFQDKPHRVDFYIRESELAYRELVERILFWIFIYIPTIIYNLCRGGVTKIESKS